MGVIDGFDDVVLLPRPQTHLLVQPSRGCCITIRHERNILYLFGDLVAIFRPGLVRDVLVISWGDKAGHKALFFGLVLLGFLVAGLGYWAGVRGIGAGLDAGTGTTTPVTPGSIDTGGHFEPPLITVIALLLGAISLIAALVLVILDLGNKLRQLPSLDLMVICGTFTLPMGVAFVIDVIIKRWNSLDYTVCLILYRRGDCHFHRGFCRSWRVMGHATLAGCRLCSTVSSSCSIPPSLLTVLVSFRAWLVRLGIGFIYKLFNAVGSPITTIFCNYRFTNICQL